MEEHNIFQLVLPSELLGITTCVVNSNSECIVQQLSLPRGTAFIKTRKQTSISDSDYKCKRGEVVIAVKWNHVTKAVMMLIRCCTFWERSTGQKSNLSLRMANVRAAWESTFSLSFSLYRDECNSTRALSRGGKYQRTCACPRVLQLARLFYDLGMKLDVFTVTDFAWRNSQMDASRF